MWYLINAISIWVDCNIDATIIVASSYQLRTLLLVYLDVPCKTTLVPNQILQRYSDFWYIWSKCSILKFDVKRKIILENYTSLQLHVINIHIKLTYQERAPLVLNRYIMVKRGIFWTIGEYSYFGLFFYFPLSKDKGL